MPSLINCQTFKMISQIESFLCPDKQGTLKEGWRIERPKPCVSTYPHKDEANSSKHHNQINTLMMTFDITSLENNILHSE